MKILNNTGLTMDPKVHYSPLMSIKHEPLNPELWGIFVEFQLWCVSHQLISVYKENKILRRVKCMCQQSQEVLWIDKSCPSSSVWRCLIFLSVHNDEKQSLKFLLCRSVSVCKTIILHRDFTWTAAQRHSNNVASNSINEIQAFCSKHKCTIMWIICYV